MDAAQTTQAITAVETIILNLETALIALADPTIFQYKFDSGQSTQSVTRRDIPELTRDLQAAYTLLATLEARLTGRGVVQVVPLW